MSVGGYPDEPPHWPKEIVGQAGASCAGEQGRGDVAAVWSGFGVELLLFYFFFPSLIFLAGALCVCEADD